MLSQDDTVLQNSKLEVAYTSVDCWQFCRSSEMRFFLIIPRRLQSLPPEPRNF